MGMRAVFSCGRFNPPTKGHLKLVERMRAEALSTGGDVHLFTTRTHDPERNPLEVDKKVKFLRQAFPDVPVDVAITPVHAFEELVSNGYTDLMVFLGQDRIELGMRLLECAKKTGVSLEVCFLDRSDADVSATAARQACINNDRDRFAELSACTDVLWCNEVFAAVRQGMEKST